MITKPLRATGTIRAKGAVPFINACAAAASGMGHSRIVWAGVQPWVAMVVDQVKVGSQPKKTANQCGKKGADQGKDHDDPARGTLRLAKEADFVQFFTGTVRFRMAIELIGLHLSNGHQQRPLAIAARASSLE